MDANAGMPNCTILSCSNSDMHQAVIVSSLGVSLHVSEVGSTGFVVGLHEGRDDAALRRYCVLH